MNGWKPPGRSPNGSPSANPMAADEMAPEVSPDTVARDKVALDEMPSDQMAGDRPFDGQSPDDQLPSDNLPDDQPPSDPLAVDPTPAPYVPSPIPFVELAVTTNFSFLRGGSHPEDYVEAARALGHRGIGIADRNSLAGVVRAYAKAKALDFPLAVGARLAFCDGTPDILAYPVDRAAYGRLCRLLTAGNLKAEKGDCILVLDDLLAWIEGLRLIVMPPVEGPATLPLVLARLTAAAPRRVWLAAVLDRRGDDARRLARLADIAAQADVRLLASADALYHHPAQRPLHDVLTCIREHVTLDGAGRLLEANGERHLKSPQDMAHLFRALPEAVAETHAFFSQLHFSLADLKPTYPRETRAGFETPQAALEALAHAGAVHRYDGEVPDKVRTQLAKELEIIGTLGYAPYFLTVHEIVTFARGQGILCQGRGSAANSVVCFCLEVTEVDPMRTTLLFERFISKERDEPPDIDIDFEHERRGEVLAFVYARYGAAHAGLAATTITYRTRSAVREVGKVFGLSEDLVGALSGGVWGWSSAGVTPQEAGRLGLDPADPRLAQTLALTTQIMGFPRHLSQHVGGMVVTHDRLDETVPLTRSAMEDRPIIEWNKDDLEQVDLLKVDVLALGMLTALQKCFALLRETYGLPIERICQVPPEDKRVYAMLQRADSIGVFQVESRAQQTMLPRLRPERFEDLVVEVAIVRPGPIQGGMVHPYLRRKQGLDPIVYPSEALREVLEATLGVPLFQEQAMQISMIAGGFEAGEADQLRRAMATFKRVGTIKNFHDKLIDGMVGNNYPRAFAESLWKQIEGFGSYGFPRSHAESFALLVYASAWIKCHYPDVFLAGLLNAWPMGFYAPAQLVRDAREHGVEIRPVDINASNWDHMLEPLAPPEPAGEEAPIQAGGLPWDLTPAPSSPRLHPDGGAAPEADGPGQGPGQGARQGQGSEDRLRAEHPSNRWNETQRPAPWPGDRAPARLHPRHGDMAGDILTTQALRLGLRQVTGLREADGRRLAAHRGAGYDSVRDLWLRTGLSVAALERLADADAFRSLGLDRRAALWAVRGLGRAGDKDDLPLLRAAQTPCESEVELPTLPPGAQVIADYRHLSLSLKRHPVAFLRETLARRGITPCGRLPDLRTGRKLTLAGLVLVRQRPGTASGVIFMTIEDEEAWANIIVWPRVFEAFRPQVMGSRLVAVTGRLQNEANVVHLIADRLEDWSSLLEQVGTEGRRIDTVMPTDEVRHGAPASRKPREAMAGAVSAGLAAPLAGNVQAIPKGRNFH